MSLRILNLDPDNYAPEALRILESLGTVDGIKVEKADLARRIADYDVLVLRFAHRIDTDLIKAANRLKVIATNATGLDHIDLAAAAARDITVISLKGETAFLRDVSATAELTWGLLLALTRKLAGAVRDTLDGRWRRDAFVGTELAGKRLGIVGYGRIGEKIAAYGRAFGMTVLAHDIHPHPTVEGIVFCGTLFELLNQSDVLTVHVPFDETTRGLIGAYELSLLPAGAYVLNTSRGGVINEQALLAALESGKIAGAALDVLADEITGRPTASPLLDYARGANTLLITPHIGGATRESWRKTEIFIAGKIADFFRS
jgi:D-3-phosphoglycerate dehydrogenase